MFEFLFEFVKLSTQILEPFFPFFFVCVCVCCLLVKLFIDLKKMQKVGKIWFVFAFSLSLSLPLLKQIRVKWVCKREEKTQKKIVKRRKKKQMFWQ